MLILYYRNSDSGFAQLKETAFFANQLKFVWLGWWYFTDKHFNVNKKQLHLVFFRTLSDILGESGQKSRLKYVFLSFKYFYF